MKQSFKRYRYIIETCVPVHIGCDEVYEPSNFLIVKKNMNCPECGGKIKDGMCLECGYESPEEEVSAESHLYSFTPNDLMKSLDYRAQQELLTLAKRSTDPTEINAFFKKYATKISQNATKRASVSKDIIDKYEKNNKLTIERTIYDKKTGQPYIPGSSIKGAITTAFLNCYQEQEAKSKLSKIKISDAFITTPVLTNISVKKYYGRRSLSDDGVKSDVEIIPVGSVFKGDIEIEIGNQLSVNYHGSLLMALNKFFKQEFENEHSYASKRYLIGEGKLLLNKMNQIASDSAIIRLGKYGNAECLTINGQRRIGRYASSHANGLSLYEGKLPFGWCKITLKEDV